MGMHYLYLRFMKRLVLVFTFLSVFIGRADYTIVIHGGAGTISKKTISPEKEKEIRKALNEAIAIGEGLLKKGEKALVVVEKVVMFMEDSPLFNAGKGAVFTNEGRQEMDACIMDGRDLSVGAIAGVSNLKNPIVGARLVKDSTRHVFLSGIKGQDFCLAKGAEYADSSYFFVQRRWEYLQRKLKEEKNQKGENDGGAAYMDEGSEKYGTVGCVVVDSYGNLAAATSTGGLTNKKYGRIGDSPIVGAGTYADNNSCAVSCTGTGEYFIRGTIARDIAALMEFKGLSLEKAGTETLNKLTKMKGDGGFVGVDKEGNVIMLFNTEGMYRGYKRSDMKQAKVELYEN
jgi:beta-aspartyl-peptidase (threonine type)